MEKCLGFQSKNKEWFIPPVALCERAVWPESVKSELTSKHLSRHIIYIWAPHEYYSVCVLPSPPAPLATETLRVFTYNQSQICSFQHQPPVSQSMSIDGWVVMNDLCQELGLQLSCLHWRVESRPPHVSRTSVAALSICLELKGTRLRNYVGQPTPLVIWLNIHHGSLQSSISRLDYNTNYIRIEE